MNKKSFFASALVIWLVCVGSMVGVNAYMHKRPRPKASTLRAIRVFNGLDSEEKTHIVRHDSAVIWLSDESYQLIGLRHEPEEASLLSRNKITARKLEIRVDDPILLERQWMINEAFRSLNEAERKCIEDGFASILYNNGDYVFFYDPVQYLKYVKKYGTECRTCNEISKSKTK